jgi:allantoicase
MMTTGNEAPQASVEAMFSSHDPNADDPRVRSTAALSCGPPLSCLIFDRQWIELLPKVDLGPSSRHLFKIPESSRVNYVKLNMYPDGGIVCA